MPPTQTPSPIAAPAQLAEAALLAATPGAPPRLAVNARQAWAAASPLVQSQAATLVIAEDVEGKTFGALGIPAAQAIRLPSALALVTITSAAANWLTVEPEQGPGLAALVLRRLRTASYPTEALTPLEVYAACWLSAPRHPNDAAASLLIRAEALIAAGADNPDALELGRGLLAAGRRRVQLERNGLILPAEARRALGNLAYSDVTAATGAPPSAISTWLGGTRRCSDPVAIWLLARLDADPSLEPASEKRKGGRPRGPGAWRSS